MQRVVEVRPAQLGDVVSLGLVGEVGAVKASLFPGCCSVVSSGFALHRKLGRVGAADCWDIARTWDGAGGKAFGAGA